MNNDDLPKTITDEALDTQTSPDRLATLAEYPVLQPLVAANPNASPTLLTSLSSSKERATRRAVAENPNASVETLCSLAGEFPAEFLRNPLVPLLNLTQPDFVYRLPLSLWQCLLRDEKIPMAWVRQIQRKSPSFYLHQRQAILDLIQRHVAIGGEVPTPWHKQTVIEQIKKHVQPNQVPAFEENVDERLLFVLLTLLLPQTVSMLKETLNHFLYHEPEQELLLLNAYRNLSPRNLAHLAQKPSLPLRCLIARHPQTPKRTLFMLSVQLAPELRCALASNPRVPLPILQRLATDPEVAVRCI